MPGDQMRVGLIGCGSIGLRHLRNLRSLGVQDIVVVEPTSSGRDAARAEGAMVLDRVEGLWPYSPEAILVSSPTQSHVEHALAALDHGCHLFVEKPISFERAGLEDLRKLAARAGVTTMVGCNMRWHPGPASVQELLAGGAVGRPLAARFKTGSYLPAWRPGQDFRSSYSASAKWGGAILDCIHEVDLALWMLGPGRCVGAARLPAESLGLDTDGLAELLVRHDAGPISSVHLNFIQRDYQRSCEIVGTEGTLRWEFGQHEVVVHGADGSVADRIRQDAAWTINDMYVDELRHFLKAAGAGQPSANPLEGGIAALEIALTAREAP